MEHEKILRLLLFVAGATFALHVATRLMFPDSSHVSSIPMLIATLVAYARILCETWKKQNTNQ